mmetsp:Transcript_8844/g.17151  ORF Transcript_8844/g.17151 Transcript_8844/m.17151 type:complete len:108 (-) Transcript_8844:115-438(-)
MGKNSYTASILEALRPNPDIEKDDLMLALYWIKQVVAFIFAITVGSMKLTGLPVILVYLVVMASTSLGYSWQLVKAYHIEAWDILSEAFGPSFFMFMLTWILSFTFV